MNMAVDNDFQLIESCGNKYFFVGSPCSLLGCQGTQNEKEARILGLSLEDHYDWMVARGAKEIAKNSQTGFVVFAFEDKKKARKTAKELTKVYLKYRMAKTK